MKTDTWITPPELIKSLGDFDLDPCASEVMPWETAANKFTIVDDGLLSEWFDRVWLNPPFSNILPWIHKMSEHKKGVTLLPVRTGTKVFQNYVFPKAESILFLRGRLTFYHTTGIRASSNFAEDVSLISFSEYDSEMIHESGISGRHNYLKALTFFIVDIDEKTWKVAIETIFIHTKSVMTLNEVYRRVLSHFPRKANNNTHYKAKVRQTLQKHFLRVGKGTYKHVDK